ncbi:MAG: MBL fold metallo-hydrolase [Deltaproteobacteria bacterium]|nr:MBL fold metallo-hydrolase [Deltaproteobacteria bacterium]
METVKITILGSGTCVPSLTRSSCSVLVEIGSAKLLFDMGTGTMRRLLESGVTIGEVSHIFFSHLHPDHTGELISFLFASKYPEESRRHNRIRITAGVGFMDFYEGLKEVYGRWMELEEGIVDIFELSNSGPDCMQLGFLDINTLPMDHIESSIGYRITTPDNTSIVYTGDTDYCENAVRLAIDADLLICESAFPDELKVDGHLTPSLAGRIASEAGVENLVLTHFYPDCEGIDIGAQCRKTYDGRLVCAEDLMRIEIKDKCLNLLQ